MAPKKTIDEQLRARLSPVRGDPHEGGDENQDVLNPPLNQQGAKYFDIIVEPPSCKDKLSASGSASASSTRSVTDSRDDFIILQQNAQQEHLNQLFLLVSSLSTKIESVVEVVENSSRSMPVEPPKSDPSKQEKEKAAARNVSFENEIDDRKEVNDDNDDNFGEDNGDDYVSHNLYRDIIAESFDKQEAPVQVGSKQTRLLSHRRPRHEDPWSLKIFNKSARI